MQLQPNSTLQGGKYKIVRTLGMGGFGITYLAKQVKLNREVAIKEFFMKEFCERDANSSHVTLGTAGSKQMVEQYLQKFLKEARSVAQLNHPNIVKIHDVFEENGTAYYVMEYASGGTLMEKISRGGAMKEADATRYVLQVASALDYIHQRHMNHLDVKPANILLDENDKAILIDFGLSKHYDAKTGDQSSTTPVGISEGYAPTEQYMTNGVGVFSPATDVYSLGATYYALLYGNRPPSAFSVSEHGIPVGELKKQGVSQKVIDVIGKAMQSRMKDRYQSVGEFVVALKKKKAKPAPKPRTGVADEGTKPMGGNGKNPGGEKVVRGGSHVGGGRKVKLRTKIKRWVKKRFWPCLGLLLLLLLALALLPKMLNDANQTKVMMNNDESMTLRVNGVDYDLVWVDGGTFVMGGTAEQGKEADPDEKPTNMVTLSGFHMGKTEVTQELWEAVMGSNPSAFRGENLPVENVNWADCMLFVEKLNTLTGGHFRLPSEAEWEYAARGGKRSGGYKYSGSNRLEEVAWYTTTTNDRGTKPVAMLKPNELGLYDMSGNVWEWCLDGKRAFDGKPKTDPLGPMTTGGERILRGGSWFHSAKRCRVSNRNGSEQDIRFSSGGLRLVYSEGEFVED